MTADRRPLPDELKALKEIIGGRAADAQTMQRLIDCNLVEEFDGTALLTASGIEAAALIQTQLLRNAQCTLTAPDLILSSSRD